MDVNDLKRKRHTLDVERLSFMEETQVKERELKRRKTELDKQEKQIQAKEKKLEILQNTLEEKQVAVQLREDELQRNVGTDLSQRWLKYMEDCFSCAL